MSNIFNPSTGGAGGGLTNVNASAGTTSNNLSNLVFSNSNGVSFGLNGSTITASVNAAGGGLTNVNVSAGTTSNNLSNVVFSNSNGISFGLNGSTVTGSHNGLTSQSNQALSGSNGSFAFQTATFGNLNGLSFYTSNGSMVGSYTVPNTAAALTSQSNQALSGSNGSFTFQTATFGNLNGLSFYTSNNSLVGSYTVPVQSVQPVAVSGSNGSFAFSTLSAGNSNGMSFYTTNGSLVGSYTVPSTAGLLSAINVSAGTTSNNLSRVTFSNSNGVSFGLNGSVVTGSHNGLTTARASNDAVGLNTAFTAGPLAWTVNSGGISLNAGSAAGTSTGFAGANISGSITHNTAGINLSLSVAAPGGGGTISAYANSNTTQSSSGTMPASSVIFAGAGIASVGVSNGSVVVSVPAGGGAGDGGVFAGVSTAGNTAGSTGTVSTGNFVLVGSNNITLSQSTGAAGSAATVSILGPASSSLVGVNGISLSVNGSTISISNIGPNISAGTTSGNISNVVFSNSNGVSFGLNGSTVTASVAAPGGGVTVDRLDPFALGAESVTGAQGAGTLYFVPFLAPVGFQCDRAGLRVQISNATNSSNSWTLSASVGIFSKNASSLSLIVSGSQTYAGTASGTVGSYSLWGGIRIATVPLSTTLPAGEYFAGIWSRTSANAGGQTLNQMLASRPNSSFSGLLGQATNATNTPVFAQGRYSVSFTTAMPTAVSITQIQGNSSILQRTPMFFFANSTL